jgi:site-specific recombinase XerD
MQLSKSIEGYIIAALAEGYSPLTLTAYRSALNTLAGFIGDKEVSDITTEDLRVFMNYLVTDYTPERHKTPQTPNHFPPQAIIVI